MGWESLWRFLTNSQVTDLKVTGSCGFFTGWEILWKKDKSISSCKLQSLTTDDSKGLFSRPVCSLLSSSLTELRLTSDIGQPFSRQVSFTKDQGDALKLLIFLKVLHIESFSQLESLPPGLRQLSKLETIVIEFCPKLHLSVQTLPSSLQVLDVSMIWNSELKEEYSTWNVTNLKVIL